MDSLLVALRSYRPTAGRNPTEDFITEAWAWLLRNEDGLCARFERALGRLVRERSDPHGHCLHPPQHLPVGWVAASARTQESTPFGRLDLVCDAENGGVVFEHKTWSPVDGDQLARYRQWAQERFGPSHVVILVTAARSQWNAGSQPAGESADVELTWAFVERVCREQLAATQDGGLVEDFLTLLEQEGLTARDALSEEAIRAYRPSQDVVPLLRDLWSSLTEVGHWQEALYDKLRSQGDDREPWLRWSRNRHPRDGRFGIDFFRWWRPGVFFGVMLDPKDHRVEDSNSALGPDLALVLSYSQASHAVPSANDFWTSASVALLRERLAREHGSWDLIDGVDEIGSGAANPWHPVLLRRPLALVLRGTSSFEQQRAALLNVGREALEMLMRGGELETWAAEVRDASPPKRS